MNNQTLFQRAWPLVLVITSMVFYHIITKEMPGDVVLFASLILTYLGAAGCCVVLFFLFSKEKNLLRELKKANLACLLYGLGLICADTGFVYAYRAGWAISVGNLVVNLTAACILIGVGALRYKEKITGRQAAGLVACLAGMMLINL